MNGYATLQYQLHQFTKVAGERIPFTCFIR